MANLRYSDWSSAPASTTHGSHPSIERIVCTDNDDCDRIDQKKTSFAWCFECCIVGSLVAGICLAIVLTFWLTSKTTATESLTVAISSSNSSSSLSVSTSNSASSNTPSSTAVPSSATASTSTSTSSASSTSSISSTSSTSTSTSSSTSSTSVTTSTSATTTTQNPIIASISGSNITADQWILITCSYLAAISDNLTLEFTFDIGHHSIWYLDDISVKDPTSVEMLTNGNLEASPALTGWSIVSCGAISTAQSHSSSHSYCVTCDPGSISQSFAAIGGQVYNVTFWIYLYPGPGAPYGPTVTVTMN
ncbi:unnamed protein product [Adineta steineri]|uniref:Uncharacterized protein n=1 Tax=Adineta steineri TaxID=433720 RepID=A0A814VIP4_9BILA|nr:unnamed protein product [Adineta steineri]